MSRHAEFVSAAIESTDANSSVIASWRRSSVTYRLHPDRTVKPERDDTALREALERDASLVAIAAPFLREVYLALRRTNAAIMLTDRTGLVLSQYCGSERSRPAAKVGIRFSEADLGTGPVGTVLAEERAIMLAPGQCFAREAAGLHSVGAPIFGPDGQIAGVLACGYFSDPVDVDKSFDNILFMLISQFSKKISSHLFAKEFSDARLLLVPQVNTSTDALIAVGTDDLVIGATRGARRLLGVTDARLRATLSIRELLGSADIPDLAAAEAEHIARTMVLYANNRTLVAKALGISRSTLYRKLKDVASRTGSTRASG